MVYDAHDKKTLVLSVRAAVEKLVTHFSTGPTQQDKVRLGELRGITTKSFLSLCLYVNLPDYLIIKSLFSSPLLPSK